MTNYANIRYQPAAASTTTVADMTALIALTGMSNGDQALVQATNKLYMYSGTGWYLIATIQNNAPSAITGVSGTYELAIDGTATTITAASTDPEGFPLTWSYSTSGLGSIATISNTDNVFTITPSTTEADAGSFSLTINATDGVNGAVSTSTNLSLNFIVTVANSRYTTLLATATDTSDNNNITDSSSNVTLTPVGDTMAGTFSPYRSGGYSTYFDGTTDYIEHQGTFTLPAGTNANWTIECWVNLDQVNLNQGILRVSSTTAAGNNDDIYFSEQSGYINVACKAGGINSATSNYAMTANVWHHIAMVKNNGTIYLYNNGVYCGSVSDSNDYSGSYYIYGGLYYSTSYCFAGYLADFKISNTAIYTSGTSNFSVPTERLSSDSLTLFLTCHLPYIADGSTNDHSITINGNTSTKPFSPYDHLEYSATDHGGSVYFDGSGDALTIGNPPTLGANDYTIESWIYFVSSSIGNSKMLSQGPNVTSPLRRVSAISLITDGSFVIQTYDGSNRVLHTTSTGNFKLNNWHHVAITHEYNGGIGGTYKFWVDGELVPVNGIKTYTDSYYWNYNGIGNYDMGINAYRYNGTISDAEIYYSDYRISNTVRYTSSFTPPIAPLSSSGTTLHIKGTDASIIDKSQSANLKLIGNTTGSTTQVKFAGSKSMYFDGAGDYILTPTSDFFTYGTNDFTIECWVYIPSHPSNYSYLFAQGNSTSNTNSYGVYIQSGVFKIWNGGNIFTGTTSYSLNTWTHLAVSRSGNSLKLYINGNQEGSSVTNTSNISTGSSNGIEIARWIGIADPEYFTGYIQDFRITKGLARYTANFTPPTTPLEG